MSETKVKTQISVQSRGLSNKHDYKWQSDRGSQYSDAPYRIIPGLKQTQLNSFSVILSRSTEGLFLLISGLDSGRKDIRHRQIRNTVLWSIPNPTDRDEAIYRNIAALALRDRNNGEAKLDRYIQQAIVADKDNDYGYAVNSELLEPEAIIEDILGRDRLDSLDKLEDRVILSDRDLSIAEIADALEKHRLPTSIKNLIVINDGKTQDTIDAEKLYLSLGDILTEPSVSDTQDNAGSGEINSFNFDKLMKLAPQLTLSIITLIVVVLGLLLPDHLKNKMPLPTPQLNSLKIEVAFDGNKPSQFSYILTGDYNLAANAPALEEVKLIDSQQQSIATGKVNKNGRGWQINYSSRSRINCKQQLSIQGFDREGTSVGEAIEIPSICSDVP